MRRKIQSDDFDFLLGEKEALTRDCIEMLGSLDLRYRTLRSAAERDQIIAYIIKKIFSGTMPVAGKTSKHRWQKGWQENLDDFIASKFNLEKLTPKFFHPDQPMRYRGDYIIPISPDLELNFYKIFRRWLFRRYLSEFDNVYEFGCGTCFNLVELAQLYPNKRLWGLDWVNQSVKIARLLARHHGFNIQGQIFDLLKPDYSFKILPGSAIFAIGALEQLGKNFEPFVHYLLRQKPAIFVHTDSLIELYDENNLTDVLAIAHNQKRNYLREYLPCIQELESRNALEIIKCQRVPFGGLYHDGYSFDIWRPTAKND